MQDNQSMVVIPTSLGLEMALEKDHQHCGVVSDRQNIHDKIANTLARRAANLQWQWRLPPKHENVPTEFPFSRED